MKRLEKILTGILLVTSLNACNTRSVSQETNTEESNLETWYNSDISIMRQPDKILTNQYGERIILTDFDNDGNYDMEERLGTSPGAYTIKISNQCALGRNVELVDPDYFQQYREEQ